MEIVKTLSRSLDLNSPDDSDEDEDELASFSDESDEEFFDAEGDSVDLPQPNVLPPRIEVHSPSPQLSQLVFNFFFFSISELIIFPTTEKDRVRYSSFINQAVG